MAVTYKQISKCGVVFEMAYAIHARTAKQNHESRCKKCKEQA